MKWLLHLAADLAVGMLGLLLLAGCGLLWRLAQGPVDVTGLARRFGPSIPGISVSLRSAALAWEGFGSGDRPLDLRLTGIVLRPAAGPASTIGQARLSLALGAALAGRVAPRAIWLDDATIQIARGRDGGWRLAGEPAPAGADTGMPRWLGRLRLLRVRGGTLDFRDAASGFAASATGVDLDFSRADAGAPMQGSGRLVVAAGDARLPLGFRAEGHAGGTRVVASVAGKPASLAGLGGRFAVLAALDLPVSAELRLQLDTALQPHDADAELQAGAGTVMVGSDRIAVAAAAARLDWSPARLALSAFTLDFAPAGGTAPPPRLTATATLTPANAASPRYAADFEADIPVVAMADLGRYWPQSLGHDGRAWVVRNVTAGTVTNTRVTGTVVAGAGLSNPVLTALGGGGDGSGLAIAWLRPVPPITDARVRLAVVGPDRLDLNLLGGRQGGLALTGGTMRIEGLAGNKQTASIATTFTGALPDAIAVLDHPRLALLSRRHFAFADPAGQVSGSVDVQLPLDAHITMDDIRIAGAAKIAQTHLGQVGAGLDLDDAALDLAVDNQGLHLTGQGKLAGAPAALTLALDFTDGPVGQVQEHATVEAHPNGDELAAAGLDLGAVTGPDGLAGRAVVTVDYSQARGGAGVVRIGADLGATALASPLGWSKAAGAPASLTARVRLAGDTLVGADQVTADGPGLVVRSHAEVAAGHARALVLDRVSIGRTEAHGRIGFPSHPGGRLSVALAGETLDLSARFAKKPGHQPPPKPEPPPDDKPGAPWSLDAHFRRVLMGSDVTLPDTQATIENDGARITRLDLSAGAALSASIAAAPGGRHLRVRAEDGGEVLQALGVADNIAGGRLAIDGDYDDASPYRPLTGTATMTEFRLTDAPAIGRLLQGMTLYGLTDVMRGPGLRFSKLSASFGWRRRVLHLNNALAFSPSLGITAAGDLDFPQHRADIHGTVVPAYFFNQLLGKLPLIGKVFSPEPGGGVFAARYWVRGPMGDPHVGVNPLSVLTPGFLRGVFGK